MASDEKWYNILALIAREARGVALIALIANAAVLATIPLLPLEHRIYGFIVFACVLIGTLIGAVVVVAPSTSQDHRPRYLSRKVVELKERLVETRFLPQLIVGISRSGLVVAGLLAKQLGEEQIVPVISLCRSGRREFDNPFNRVSFTRQDFDSTSSDPIRVLIVDDVCGSGRTLDDARTYVERSLARGDFLIKTAAVSFYRSYSRPTAPDFYVDRPRESIRDASGEIEPMPK
jgi:hypoxanthine phosphoribosyltransferase